MNSTYTTHLICAPQLEGAATIGAVLVSSGSYVETDTPLVLLHSDGLPLDVCAPEAGIIGDINVSLHENVMPGDLLLTMEIEEKPFGWLPMVEDEPAFAPACQLVFPSPGLTTSVPLKVNPDAASLAARLGVDISEVKPGPGSIVDEESITSHVRDILIRWRKIKRLLDD